MKHRAICYDDEGRLDCSLRCDFGKAEREAEQASRAEAEELLEIEAWERRFGGLFLSTESTMVTSDE